MPAAPYAQILLWTVVALFVAGTLWMGYQRVRHGHWSWPSWGRSRRPTAVELEVEWVPEVAPAREWLREADSFAEQGHYAEAVHLLLVRSIDDIARRRPHLVRPAITSRELMLASVIPANARMLFADIAALVERSLFGGRAVAADDWSHARSAYADFVLPRAWRT